MGILPVISMTMTFGTESIMKYTLRASAILFALAFTYLASCSSGSSQNGSSDESVEPDAPADDIGQPAVEESVQVVSSCDVAQTFPSPTSCQKLRVRCESGLEGVAELRITPPPPEMALKATVTMHSGGHGVNFFAGANPDEGDPGLHTVRQLAMEGFRVVERRWVDGWFGDHYPGQGVAEPSCLGGVLLRWVAEQSEDAALCAFGNSGGSAEIGYALTRWGAADMLEAAILSGGPPMARLDVGCLGESVDEEWRTQCAQLWEETQKDCPPQQFPEPHCTLTDREIAAGPLMLDAAFAAEPGRSPCTGADSTMAQQFFSDSILNGQALLNYPETDVHFLIGAQDCTEAPILGYLYYDAIDSSKSLSNPTNTRHVIQSTPDGVTALLEAISTYCH